MTAIKLQAALPANTVPDKLARDMWDGLGSHHLAIVELMVSERTEPASEDTELSAKLRVAGIEFARTPDDAEHLRRAMKARWEARTSVGTLVEDIVDETGTEVDAPSFIEALVDFINAEGLHGHVAVAKLTKTGCTITVDRLDESA